MHKVYKMDFCQAIISMHAVVIKQVFKCGADGGIDWAAFLGLVGSSRKELVLEWNGMNEMELIHYCT